MTKIKNLGPKSTVVLKQLDLNDLTAIKSLGWKKIMLLIAQHNSKYVNVNMAYALIGAINNKSWLNCSEKEKCQVIKFIKDLKKNIKR